MRHPESSELELLRQVMLPERLECSEPSGAFWQAAYRPRDVAKQREPARTSDQLGPQFRGGFRAFVQVSGLGCIDLGDRRSSPYEAGTSPAQRAPVRSASIDLRSSDGQKVRLGTPVLWAPQRLKKCRPTGPT